MIQKGPQIREGKAKVLFETLPTSDRVIQYFKDDATAFNAQKKGSIENKGQINNTVSGWIFEYLKSKGVPTHFVQQLSEREMLVRKVQIIPIEVVVRNRAAGSICKRLGLEKGQPFQTPLVEFFYKDDSLGDPLVGETHILNLGWANRKELDHITSQALKVNALLSAVFKSCGLELIDFKLEFGRDATSGDILLADEFSPDGCRLWDTQTGESMDKDRFRLDLGHVSESYQEVYKRLSHFFGRAS